MLTFIVDSHSTFISKLICTNKTYTTWWVFRSPWSLLTLLSALKTDLLQTFLSENSPFIENSPFTANISSASSLSSMYSTSKPWQPLLEGVCACVCVSMCVFFILQTISSAAGVLKGLPLFWGETSFLSGTSPRRPHIQITISSHCNFQPLFSLSLYLSLSLPFSLSEADLSVAQDVKHSLSCRSSVHTEGLPSATQGCQVCMQSV